MTRVLLAPMPYTGHVMPLLAVASELRAHGHDVRVYTGSRFRERVEASGADLVPWRQAPDFDENDLAATFPRLVGKKGMRQLFANLQDAFIATAPAMVADLTDEWDRRPWDVLASDETSIGAALFAERTEVPWATVAVLPLNLAGTQGPPSGLGITPGTNPLTRARDAVLRGLVPLIARPLSTHIARARAAVGLAPTRLTMEKLVFSRELVVASGIAELDYGRTDRPANLHFVGRIAPPVPAPESTPEPLPGPEPVLPTWWSDLAGRTVVLVTQGTQNIDPDDLIRPALHALADVDALVVATTGVPGRDELPFPVPANARVAGFVPFEALLPHVDVAITNGGWGGTLATLSRGIPLIIAGGDLDKPEVAARVAWAGAGVNLRTGTPTSAAVRRGFDQVMTDASYRTAAEHIGARLAGAGGAARAAELLAGLADR